MAALDMADSVAARDALLEVVPALVREYGTVAASAAADWYEGLRSTAGIQIPHVTVLSAGANLDAVAGSTRYAASRDNTQSILFGAIQRYISYSARDTIRRNAANDRSRPRYGRVPTGAKTCAFCEMLASRGFVYHSQATAGDKARAGFGTDFHDDCDCQIVVEWDADTHHIAGYDPDAMYARYVAARATQGPHPSTQGILASMRRMNPGAYTDGVFAN